MLFTLYVNDLLSIPKHCKAMGYVDDTKLLLTIPSKEASEAIPALNNDLRAIAQWCCMNSLLINPDKTKVLTVGVPQRLKSLPPLSVTLLGESMEVVPAAKDLGVIVDKYLNYNEHVTKTVSNCFFKLSRINRIKHLLDTKTLILLINSFIFSKPFYCSTVWSNTTKTNKNKLQLVQNYAARVVLGLRKYDHISEGLKSLKWLNMQEKLYLNDCIMMHKCIYGDTPRYISNKFTRRCKIHQRITRQNQDLDLPACRLASGQRSFAYRGSKIWNELPKGIKSIENIKTFKKHLINHIVSR